MTKLQQASAQIIKGELNETTHELLDGLLESLTAGCGSELVKEDRKAPEKSELEHWMTLYNEATSENEALRKERDEALLLISTLEREKSELLEGYVELQKQAKHLALKGVPITPKPAPTEVPIEVVPTKEETPARFVPAGNDPALPCFTTPSVWEGELLRCGEFEIPVPVVKAAVLDLVAERPARDIASNLTLRQDALNAIKSSFAFGFAYLRSIDPKERYAHIDGYIAKKMGGR